MTLDPGTRLGPYEVVGSLGAGGMGEVFRARDTKLGREVALKVLPASFADDAERLARFEREAKTLAALNHPHVAQVYGFEEGAHVRALVMELVPGESLANRLARGSLPVREALDLARQIADGLGAAHEKDIVHRDLKPANVQVTPEGVAKVLDFGLARPAGPAASADPGDDDAATITSPAQMTKAGIVLGTAAYMSPEQARGLRVDARTDVWAFGAVLYEMLTGARAFAGATVTDVLAAVLEREPDWTKLPPATPAAIRALLQRCLRKESRQRLHNIADARFTLEDTLAALASTSSGVAIDATGVNAIPAPPARAVWRHPLPLGLAFASLALGGAIAWSLGRTPEAPAEEPMYLSLVLPPGQELTGRLYDVSPDGRDIVYAAVAEEVPPGPEGNQPRLYHRRLTDAVPRALPGTEGAVAPFFSPDGAWVAFTSPSDRALKKIALAGGGPVVVSEELDSWIGFGKGWWTETGQILIPSAGPLTRVPASGGKREVVVPATALEAGDYGIMYPFALPGQSATLFSPNRDKGAIAAWMDGQRRTLQKEGYAPQLSPSGYLVFWRRSSPTQVDLCAVTFDATRAVITGEPVPVLSDDASGGWSYALSRSGTLVYPARATGVAAPSLFGWVARGDRPVPPLPPPPEPGAARVRSPRVSPDGRQLLYSRVAIGRPNQFLVVDLGTGVTRVLASGAGGQWGAWSHDGRRVIYQDPSGQGGIGLTWKVLDGSAPAERLTESRAWQEPEAVTRDGQFLIYQESGGTGAKAPLDQTYDLWLLPLVPLGEPRPLLRTKANERLPSLSSDQRWMAYVSDESGRDEVWMRAFPDGTASLQVSQDGGTEPLWAPDGRTLYYRDVMGTRLFAVPVTAGAVPQFGTPVVTPGYWHPTETWGRMYDITPDGNALLMLSPAAGRRELRVVLNFDEVIRRTMAGEK